MNTYEEPPAGSAPRVPVAVATRDHVWARIKSLVLDGLTSAHSRRAYAIALDDFQQWCAGNGSPEFGKATVQRYRASLEQQKPGPSTSDKVD